MPDGMTRQESRMHPKNFKDAIAASPCVFTLGVSGDSGSGKTTFTEGVRSIFGDDLVSTITLDDYHSLDRDGRIKQGITALDPRANRIEQIERDLIRLKQGIPIEKPVYNHTTGTFDPPVLFQPKKILILEGLHTLFTPKLRKYLDFSLFVDPAQPVKYDWKIRRDMEKRGYSREAVMKEITGREPDYKRYIAPQKEFADAMIGIDYSEFGQDLGRERKCLPDHPVAEPDEPRNGRYRSLPGSLFHPLPFMARNFSLKFLTSEHDDRQMGTLVMDGELREDVGEKLERSIENQTGVYPISIFKHQDYVPAGGLAQLILCWRIIHRRIFMETCR